VVADSVYPTIVVHGLQQGKYRSFYGHGLGLGRADLQLVNAYGA
jgi:hypothetical protein